MNVNTTRDDKAYLNAEDLNRIEGNIASIINILNQFHYLLKKRYRTWDKYDIPTKTDFERICGYIDEMAEKYHRPNGYEDLSKIPEKNLKHTDLNNMEKNLLLINNLLDLTIAGFKKAPFQSGKNSFYQLRKGACNHDV